MVTSQTVVFPFLLPIAIFSSIDKTEKPGLLLYLLLSPFIFSYCGELNKLVPFVKCRICLPEAEWSGVALKILHCTDPLHPGRAVELYPFEVKRLFPLH